MCLTAKVNSHVVLKNSVMPVQINKKLIDFNRWTFYPSIKKNLLSFTKKKHNRLTKIGGKVKRKKKVLEMKKREGKNNYRKILEMYIYF